MRAFAVFAERLNFTSAAAALHISQPSLHVKIQKLGTGLGVDLYRREGRRLVLTEEGERLAAFAQDSRRRVDDFLDDLGEGSPVVRIAAGRGALRWVISSAIRRIARAGRTVEVLTANRDAAIAAVLSGQSDVAVTALDPPPSTVASKKIASFPQVLVVPAAHPLADRTRVRVAELEGLDLLLPPPGRPHRRAIDRALAAAGVSCRVAAEVDGWDLLVHFAGLGLGATVVNGCVQVPARLRAVAVADLPPVGYWAAWRPPRRSRLVDVLNELGTP